MDRWRLGHRPSLTGLRAIAVALVLATHIGAPYSGELGATGVTMFFTLSGFLITVLLLEERQRTTRISILMFYRRRLLRLGPALVVCVICAVGAEILVTGSVSDWSLVIGALTWTSNFFMMDGHFPVTPLSHTWSLAVEEQFYLLWPLLLLAVVMLPKRWALLLVAYLAVTGIVIRIAVLDPTVYLGHAYLGLDTRADQLLIGAFLAIALIGTRGRTFRHWWATALIAAVVVVGFTGPYTVLYPTVVALLTGGALYFLCQGHTAWLEARPLVWLGERAYGVYLYHRPIGYAVDHAMGPSTEWWASGLVTITITMVAASLSYRWLEMPIRNWGLQSTRELRPDRSAV